jgi:hypothetical protein
VPGTTATQGLIYPTSTDRACDGALQLEVLAKGINARYVVLDGAIDDAATPPAVLVEWVSEDASAEPLGSINGIMWNTVSVDDAEAYNAAVNAATLTLPYTAPGQLWEIGMFAIGEWDAVPDVEVEFMVNLRITGPTGTVLYDFGESGAPMRPSGFFSGGQSLVVLHETSGNDVVSADWTTFNTGYKLEFAQLWAFQVGAA